MIPNSRECLLGNGEQMGSLGSSLFPRIHLHHPRDIERINPSKRVGSYQHYSTVCVYLFLGVSQSNRLENCVTKVISRAIVEDVRGRRIPAGSFKWDRFVRSSLASSIVGFINGGRLESESSSNAAAVISTFFCCSSRRY